MDKDVYRNKAMSEYYKIVDSFRATRRMVLDREAHSPTIEKQIAEAKKEADAKLNTLLRELNDTVNDAEKIVQVKMQEEKRKAKDPNRAGYVQVNASNAFEGLTPKEIIEKFPEYVKGLHPDDQPYQYVVEDLAKARMRGKGDVGIMNHVIEACLPAEGKFYLSLQREVEALKDSHKTLTGMMQMTLKDIGQGGERADLDVAETFDALMSGHGKYNTGKSE